MFRQSIVLVALCAALGGCAGGHLSYIVKLPPPSGETTTADGVSSFTPGINVVAKDGSSVCSRLRLFIKPMASAPSDPSQIPQTNIKYTGRGLGTYTPEKRECIVAMYGMEPRDDY